MSRVVPVSPEVFVRVLKSFGLVPARQVGSHLMLTRPGISRPVVVPMHRKMLPAFIILNDLRTAGISRGDYLERLNSL